MWFRKNKEQSEPVVHDLTDMTAYNCFILDVIDKGQRLRLSGWKPFSDPTLHLNDYLILTNKDETTRYQIIEIDYMSNPRDQWFATVKFSPRSPPDDK